MEASAKATEAQRRAEAAETRVQVIVDELPEDQRRVSQIPRDIDDARKDVRDAHSQVPLVVVVVVVVVAVVVVAVVAVVAVAVVVVAVVVVVVVVAVVVAVVVVSS